MAHEFNEEELKKFHEAFSIWDKDNDGTVSTEELELVLRSLGQNPTDAQLRDVINEMDTEGNGVIDFNGFLNMMAKKQKEDSISTAEKFRDAFKVFDKDGDGFISATELQHVMKSFGEDLTKDEAEEMVKQADIDGDGQIDYKEFYEMMVTEK